MSGVGRQLRRTVPAVLTTAVVGGLGTRPRSAWYLSLRKPPWQPPPAAFGPAWTTLYALIAASTAQALAEAGPEERRRIERAAWLNLGLNAAWSWLFFTARRPDLALAGILALDLSNADLARRVGRVDARAGAALTPYLAWTWFATALNADILRRNRAGLR
ncbi:MAG TPA: tryptophan-rich sensory protein [Nocardioides sp.]|uniref:TspO/MBR family protein n=1 Tax=Nocardioides sp. TaxID=35761 RepID=UPI002D1B8AB0|nr:TspO/MBR family protein [Nocardioides sp.]HQR26847.1 tryptophan-rich sensory protein [Nocardioides sp.]